MRCIVLQSVEAGNPLWGEVYSQSLPFESRCDRVAFVDFFVTRLRLFTRLCAEHHDVFVGQLGSAAPSPDSPHRYAFRDCLHFVGGGQHRIHPCGTTAEKLAFAGYVETCRLLPHFLVNVAFAELATASSFAVVLEEPSEGFDEPEELSGESSSGVVPYFARR